MQPIINIAVKAARRAGEIINQSIDRMDTVNISEKSPNNFVTSVDKACEEAIIDVLTYAYPDYSIIAEESGVTLGKQRENCWIIDPLDGTTNFIHGIPQFAISIALKQGDHIEHGVVYDPVRDDLFTASRGGGARLNGRRLRVGQCPHISKALLAIGYPHNTGPEGLDNYFKMLKDLTLEGAGLRRLGAATLDLCYVACGRVDGYFESGIHPWDIAAGSLIAKEAGAFVTDFAGGEDYLKQGKIVTGNPRIQQVLLAMLQH